MAHFAELNSDNIVKRVVVVDNEMCLDENGDESEIIGIYYLSRIFGGTWRQCSYNGNIRKNFPSPGFSFREDINAFVEPKVFDSWILNEETARWEPPVAMPEDGNVYGWNESSGQWDLLISGE